MPNIKGFLGLRLCAGLLGLVLIAGLFVGCARATDANLSSTSGTGSSTTAATGAGQEAKQREGSAKITGSSLRALATGAYYYGLPLMMEDALRSWFTNTEKPVANKAPLNQLSNSAGPILGDKTGLLQSNCDVRLWQAMLDLTAEPLVLQLPSMQQYMYYTVYDTAGNPVKSGPCGGQYLLRASGDETPLPARIPADHLLELPARCFLVIRIVCTSPEDRAMVALMEDKRDLRPLSQLDHQAYQPPQGSYNEDLRFAPKNVVLQQGIESYFTRLNQLFPTQPQSHAKKDLSTRFAAIGVGEGKSFRLSAFSSVTDLLMLSTLSLTAAEQLEELDNQQPKHTGWVLKNGQDPQDLSLIQNAYRAVYTPHAEPLNCCAEYRTTLGSDAKPLSGLSQYRFTIPADLLPKHVMYSVAIYHAGGNAVSTGFDRAVYSTALQPNKNGSVTVEISAAKDPENTNHLTCLAGEFQLVVRIYGCTDTEALKALKLPTPVQSNIYFAG